MICKNVYHGQQMTAKHGECSICQGEQLDRIEKMLKTLCLQVNTIEEEVVEKISDDV